MWKVSGPREGTRGPPRLDSADRWRWYQVRSIRNLLTQLEPGGIDLAVAAAEGNGTMSME